MSHRSLMIAASAAVALCTLAGTAEAQGQGNGRWAIAALKIAKGFHAAKGFWKIDTYTGRVQACIFHGEGAPATATCIDNHEASLKPNASTRGFSFAVSNDDTSAMITLLDRVSGAATVCAYMPATTQVNCHTLAIAMPAGAPAPAPVIAKPVLKAHPGKPK